MHQLVPLSGLDAAFLALDSPTTPMHMGAVGIFNAGGPLDVTQLTALLAERAARIDRLRLRVRSTWLPPGGAVWEPDPRFDATSHIRVRRLHGADFERYAAEWISRPLPECQAMWSLELVPDLPGGEFAMLLKLHHALTDGTGAVEVAAGLLDDVPRLAGMARSASPERASEPADAAASVVRMARRVDRDVRSAAGLGYELARSLRLGYTSPLGTRNTTSRRLRFVRLDTDDLRRIRKIHGGTPNDVVMAVLSGALRSWLDGRERPTDGMTMRALIPVSLRGRNLQQSGGNRLSGYLCDLPVGVDDPIERLRLVRDRMDHNKAAGPLKGGGVLPVIANQVPVAVHRLATGLIARAGSTLFDTVVTNVPLPRVSLTLGGAELRASYPIVPLAPGQALGVAISPYRDSVHIGLQADARAIPDLDALASALEKETARLHELCV